jgi:hypothetical protein
MYYLVRKNLNLDDTPKIVGNCSDPVHKYLVVKNYCIKKHIISIENEYEIVQKCTSNEVFLLKTSEDEYVIIQSNKIHDGYVFYGYVDQQIIGYLNFCEYQNEELPLSSLKVQDKQKVLNV